MCVCISYLYFYYCPGSSTDGLGEDSPAIVSGEEQVEIVVG